MGIRAGKRWAKILFVLYSLINFSFITLPTLRLSALSAEMVLLLLSTSLHFWGFFIVTRDLLRRPIVVKANIVEEHNRTN